MDNIAEFMTNEEIRQWAFQLDEPFSKKSKLNNSLPQISSSATINRACQKQQDKKIIPKPQSKNKEIILRLKSQNKQLRDMIQAHKELLEQLKE